MTVSSCIIGSPLPSPSPSNKMNLAEEIASFTIAKGGIPTPFPYKLYIMLNAMETDAANGNARGKSIVGWQSHGRSFKVHNVKAFVETIMPEFFKQTKYSSFQRQLNLYGFVRITGGPDKGAVYHPCFLQKQPRLIQKMVRKRIKGTKTRKAAPKEVQPDFYQDEKRKVMAAVDAAFTEAEKATRELQTTSNLLPTIFPSTIALLPTEPLQPIVREQFLAMETPSQKVQLPTSQKSVRRIQPLQNQKFSLMHYNHGSHL